MSRSSLKVKKKMKEWSLSELVTVSFIVFSFSNLNGSGQAGPKWQFSSNLQVAQNPLKFAMSTLFVLKNVPVVFFSRRQKSMDKIAWKSTPPPPSLCPSPNNIGFWPLRAKTLCVCFFPCLWWKKPEFFSQKKSRHGKFQRILSNLENRYEFVTWDQLPWTERMIPENWQPQTIPDRWRWQSIRKLCLSAAQ